MRISYWSSDVCSSDLELYAISDRSGWWNIYRVGGKISPICPVNADFGGPQWRFGGRWFVELGNGHLLTARTVGTDLLAVLDPRSDKRRVGIECVSTCSSRGWPYH